MRYIVFSCLLFLLFSVVACKQSPKRPDDLPKLTPCVIAVTFGGEKVEGVGVLLLPEDPSTNKWNASGRTNAEGKAKMITSSVFEGAVPGTYTISFQKNAEQIGTESPPSVIPEKYRTGKSKETITVAKEQQEYVFELESLKKTK
jgi:hypothetical protein